MREVSRADCGLPSAARAPHQAGGGSLVPRSPPRHDGDSGSRLARVAWPVRLRPPFVWSRPSVALFLTGFAVLWS